MPHILYKNKYYGQLTFTISAGAPFNAILHQINNIEIPRATLEMEHVRYAILELINNSLRAQREKERNQKILLKVIYKQNNLEFQLKDWGGGFNPKNLPYDIADPYDRINVQSSRFQSYREQHQYRRFGMGLLSCKKVFPRFEIHFHDGNNNIGSYQPGLTQGTLILLEVPLMKEENQ